MRRPPTLIRSLLLAGTLAAVAIAAGPAAARTTAEPTAAYRAAVSLAKGETVYIDPSQTRVFSRNQADRVRGKIIHDGGAPIFIAILPGNAASDDGARQLKELTALLDPTRKATIGVVTGGRLRAASTAIPYATAQRYADEAIAATDGEPLDITIMQFIGSVSGEVGKGDSGGTGGVITGAVMAFVVFAGSGILLLRRRRRWRELNRLQPLVEEDLSELARELATIPEADAASVREPLERARRAFKLARGVEHLPQVAAELGKARSAVAAVRAGQAGEAPPPGRAPCFFDARHGASSAAVDWSPAGGATARSVPACAADAQRLESGLAPEARMVELADERLAPWFEGGPEYGYYLAAGSKAVLAGLPVGRPLRKSRWLP